MIHELKCWPDQFAEIKGGDKTAEYRLNDRNFMRGDTLALHEYDPETHTYTGDVLYRSVSHVLRDGFGLPEGYCMLSLKERGH